MTENKTNDNALEFIAVVDCTGELIQYENPTNIVEHMDNDGWLEFDTRNDMSQYIENATITIRHHKLYMATIVGYTYVVSKVRKNVE